MKSLLLSCALFLSFVGLCVTPGCSPKPEFEMQVNPDNTLIGDDDDESDAHGRRTKVID
ncbi:MAG TPA: hypothetical protein PKD64_10035 [Pirellulaceae bacterium]|nr:hypothetical protein [Pirellulaceae bacterium]HMO92520.1 hypothetical protein [Pirellulaceae bacterium]HMP68997.1 hypothetical protein [Pirellulaceae bacterium]